MDRVYNKTKMKKQGLHPSQILIIIILSFLAGVMLGSWWTLPFTIAVFILICLIIVAFFFWREKEVSLLALALIFILFGQAFFNYRNCGSGETVSNYYNKKVQIWGRIAQPPENNLQNQSIIINAREVRVEGGGNSAKNISGQILIYLPRYPKFLFGDELKINGTITEPQTISGFDYKSYLAASNIYATMFQPQIEKTTLPANQKGNFLNRSWITIEKTLYNLKDRFDESMQQILAEPYSGLLAGLILGEKKGLPASITDQFAATGTSHIIVISGYNISVIIIALSRLMKNWSTKITNIILVTCLVVFVVIVGAGASVVRAAVMAGALLLATHFGRQRDGAVALLLAALILVLINPKIMRFDIGFQLSFLATVGLFYLIPIFEAWYHWLERQGWWGIGFR